MDFGGNHAWPSRDISNVWLDEAPIARLSGLVPSLNSTGDLLADTTCGRVHRGSIFLDNLNISILAHFS